MLNSPAMGDKPLAILYAVLASAKSNQVEPFAYGRDLLERLGQPTAMNRQRNVFRRVNSPSLQ